VSHARIEDPAHGHECAEEARSIADAIAHPGAKQTLLRIAESNEELAKLAETLSAQSKKIQRGADPTAKS